MIITRDLTKWVSAREEEVVLRLLAYAINGNSEAVERMLANRSCKSLIVRGVIKVTRT